MSWPASGMEAMYRNPIGAVADYLDSAHPNTYHIYNLVAERDYPHSYFHNAVSRFPMRDHNVIPLPRILAFCSAASAYLRENDDHVAVVHCKGGKGRTGTMISALMLYNRAVLTAADALDAFAGRRTADSASSVEGVETPSQARYVRYMESVCLRFGNSLPPPHTIRVYTLRVSSISPLGWSPLQTLDELAALPLPLQMDEESGDGDGVGDGYVPPSVTLAGSSSNGGGGPDIPGNVWYTIEVDEEIVYDSSRAAESHPGLQHGLEYNSEADMGIFRVHGVAARPETELPLDPHSLATASGAALWNESLREPAPAPRIRGPSSGLLVTGDVRIAFHKYVPQKKSSEVFAFWFNTSFIEADSQPEQWDREGTRRPSPSPPVVDGMEDEDRSSYDSDASEEGEELNAHRVVQPPSSSSSSSKRRGRRVDHDSDDGSDSDEVDPDLRFRAETHPEERKTRHRFILGREEVDGAHKPKNWHVFTDHFLIELVFSSDQ